MISLVCAQGSDRERNESAGSVSRSEKTPKHVTHPASRRRRRLSQSETSVPQHRTRPLRTEAILQFRVFVNNRVRGAAICRVCTNALSTGGSYNVQGTSTGFRVVIASLAHALSPPASVLHHCHLLRDSARTVARVSILDFRLVCCCRFCPFFCPCLAPLSDLASSSRFYWAYLGLRYVGVLSSLQVFFFFFAFSKKAWRLALTRLCSE